MDSIVFDRLILLLQYEGFNQYDSLDLELQKILDAPFMIEDAFVEARIKRNQEGKVIHLNLKNSSFAGSQFAEFVEALKKNNSLTKLTLTDCHLTIHQAESLLKILGNENQTLSHIDFSNNS